MARINRVNWSSRRLKGQQCWSTAAFLALMLLTGCGPGGADGYYNDTPDTTHPQSITQAQPPPQSIQIAPTEQPPPPTLPVSNTDTNNPPSKSNGTVMLGDDYAANVVISLAAFCLSPFAFFLYAFAISGTVMRRYGFLPRRGIPNE